jgi:DUF1680 family protein
MNQPNMPNAVILDTSHSPYAKLKSVALSQILMEKGFWQTRLQLNQKVTIQSQYVMLEKTGRLDNFRRVFGEAQKPYQGHVFNDSDVYKWLEAVCWMAAYQQDSEIRNAADRVINLIIKAQDKDGYLNTFFSLEKIRERWMNLQEKHELYCAGHLIQAAIAHHRVMGNYRLLNVALRLADHICRTFGRSQVEGTSGHPEIEMALIELYRTTGEMKYLEQATLFIDRRGRGLVGSSEYLLDHVPFRKMDYLVGHAVRALYLCSGVTDLMLETGEDELFQNLQHLWTNMITQQIYITGGVGSRYEGEAFGRPYELPNARAYAETCAAIANLMWNWRMLQIDGNAKYADLLEWTLYNAVLPGISLDGNHYFYMNPLEDDGTQRRSEWFDCACCPPNIARTIAAFPGYIYGVSKEGIWLHIFAQSKATLFLMTGQRVNLEQITSYPWDGHIRLIIHDIALNNSLGEKELPDDSFGLHIRLPGWLNEQTATVKINGRPYKHHTPSGSYLEIQRRWKTGDQVDLDFPMEVHYLESHPEVTNNYHRLAISRGPLVYCLEEADNPHVNLSQIRINPNHPVEAEYKADLLGGIIQLHFRGFTNPISEVWSDHLYRDFSPVTPRVRDREITLSSIPYYAWANRQSGVMAIWNLF